MPVQGSAGVCFAWLQPVCAAQVSGRALYVFWKACILGLTVLASFGGVCVTLQCAYMQHKADNAACCLCMYHTVHVIPSLLMRRATTRATSCARRRWPRQQRCSAATHHLHSARCAPAPGPFTELGFSEPHRLHQCMHSRQCCGPSAIQLGPVYDWFRWTQNVSKSAIGSNISGTRASSQCLLLHCMLSRHPSSLHRSLQSLWST